MKHVLVSGASGFLGYAVVSKLLAAGVSVRALARSREKAECLSQLGAEIVLGDIRDPAIKGAAADIDTVIHCAAAIGSVDLSRKERYSVNVDGTRNMVETFKNNSQLRRFVHVSTVAVVGETDPHNPADEQTPCRPIDWYAETKLVAEQVVLKAASERFPAVIVRPMWIYGSRSPLTANLFRKIAFRKLPMVGSARNTMQPIAAQDAVEAVLACATHLGIEGRIYNTAGPEIITVRLMCQTIADALGTKLPKINVPLSAGIALATISESLLPPLGLTPPITHQNLEFFRLNNSYSIERARRELGWSPKIRFAEGAHMVAQELKSSGAI